MGLLPIRCLRVREGHIVVAGRTGSGKTNTVKVFLEEALKNGVKTLILDWAGEYRSFKQYIPGRDYGFYLVPETPQHASFTADLFAAVYDLSDPQTYLLYKAAKNLRPPYTLSQLIDAIEELPAKNYRELDVKAALLRRLEPLNDGPLGHTLNGRQNPNSLFQENVSLRLDKLYSLKERRLFSLILLRHLYTFLTTNGFAGRISHITVLEEAWNIIPYTRRDEPPSIGERLFLELRKYGECVIAVTQSLSDISERALKNASYIIIHPSLVNETKHIGIPNLKPPSRRGHALIIDSKGEANQLKVRKAKQRSS